jgi:chitin synthase
MYKTVEVDIANLRETEMKRDRFEQVHCVTYRGLRLTVCRFPHGGKRHAQKWAHMVLKERWCDSPVKPLVLFIDSDIVLDPYAVHMFAWEFVKPSSVNYFQCFAI